MGSKADVKPVKPPVIEWVIAQDNGHVMGFKRIIYIGKCKFLTAL